MSVLGLIRPAIPALYKGESPLRGLAKLILLLWLVQSPSSLASSINILWSPPPLKWDCSTSIHPIMPKAAAWVFNNLGAPSTVFQSFLGTIEGVVVEEQCWEVSDEADADPCNPAVRGLCLRPSPFQTGTRTTTDE